ncbi:cupin domain-containing protein [Actinomadura sp. DC4]|uniref:cupin domain-containing protein n=1 Tax=Actinomadura sp. DC4 TaxID=3055069 RepID=UPI0025B215B1|nr:cupin domain-containing protein [Actinomadura sp. DC4]MDN3353700.1 cupin domain-containing protein [Actinomadura sp. DC4]
MHLRPGDLPTMTFDWGVITWLVSPRHVDGAKSTLGEVVINPGRGHERHSHPASDEVIYVVDGEGSQMVDDGEPFTIAAGDAVHIPAGAPHSTMNTGWRALRLIVTYTPGGEEAALEQAPGYELLPPGTVQTWVRESPA